MSVLALVLGYIAVFGVSAARQPDEGVIAYIFQLLFIAHVPLVAFFAIKWLPRIPRSCLPLLAFQVVATIAALAPV